MSQPKPKRQSCLVPGCRNKTLTRGLCRRDYGICFRLVKAGETSWEALEESGRILKQIGARNNTAAKKFFLAKP